MVHLVIFQKWIAILVFDLDAVLNKYVGDISYLRCIKTCWKKKKNLLESPGEEKLW